MIGVGDQAPDFTLPSHDGRTVRLSELLAEGPVVVYFYPADFTPLCTAQACMVRDQHDRLRASGYRVVAISPQSVASHSRFADKHNLPFALLADTDKSVIRAYGVSGPFGLFTRRATFLIDTDGTVRDRVVGDLSVGKHAGLIGRALG
ncbi:MAG: peroxiredoxin [Planctomycetota bacterium]|nr:MAG: peroxiredoxin [Planctomycetota bacterium]